MGVIIPNRHLVNIMRKFLRRLDELSACRKYPRHCPDFGAALHASGNWEGGLGCYYSEREVSNVMLSDIPR